MSDTPETIYVGIPTYDEWIHINCMMGVLHASGKRHLKLQSIGSSALPFAFNQLWVGGITSGADYFAMIHADVGPESLWADTLIEELEKHDADIMSAVIPIKDMSNVYSTAMCWLGEAAHYRLTIPHYMELPDTFDTADMREVTGEDGFMCANTGLWVCRLDRPWIKEVHFEFLTGIDWSGEKPRCTFIPEDWQLSQMLHRKGAKVMCTKKVRTTHSGSHTWQSCPAVVEAEATA